MSHQATLDNFWSHGYTRTLQPKGRLALYYALQHEEEGKPIIPEDMAHQTGLNISEVMEYLRQFKVRGQIVSAL